MILKSFENCKISRIFSVIFGLVPKILVQQVTNLVNKFAILLKRSMFRQDCRNASGNDGCWGCLFNTCCNVFNASSLNVMLACEHSELPRASRNIMAILLNRMYHPEHSANSLRSKPSVTGNCVGRSMIEMLGVLAIIAVLSVGGIAGYNKAMQIWKINQSLKEYSSLVFGMLEHIDEIHRIEQEKNAQYGLVAMAEALNLIPQQWDCGEKVRECTDKQGNTIRIFGRNNRLVIDFYLGGYTWTGKNSVISQNFNPKLCEEIAAKIFQPLHSMMYTGYIVEQNLYGDAFCGKNIPCIKDVSLSTINQLCNACTEDNSGCALVLTY